MSESLPSNQRRECRHETLHFGSGDYYIFCANSECGARWVCCGTGSDLPDAHLSNQGVGGQLSGQERSAVETAVPRDPVWPHGGHRTEAAGRAERPVIGAPLTSAGLLLYCYVYEARWAGLRTTELCPRWIDLPQMERDGWERLALEIAGMVPRSAEEPGGKQP